MNQELVTTLKRHATRLLANLRRRKTPILITEHGRPAAVLVDIESYERERARIQVLEGIARGERAIRDRRTLTHRQAKQRMRRWLD